MGITCLQRQGRSRGERPLWRNGFCISSMRLQSLRMRDSRLVNFTSPRTPFIFIGSTNFATSILYVTLTILLIAGKFEAIDARRDARAEEVCARYVCDVLGLM